MAWCLLLGACAARESAGPAHPTGTVSQPQGKAERPEATQVPVTVVTPVWSSGVDELFADGMQAYEQQRYKDAVRSFEALVRAAPNDVNIPEALHHTALAEEALGHHSAAAERFEELIHRFPEAPRAREARVRAMRLLVYLEQWQRGGDLAQALLAETESASPRERIVILSTQALALLDRGELGAAEYYVGRARREIETHRFDAAGAIPRDLAQAYYALGELRRQRAARIRFTPLPDDFPSAFESRAQLLLDAQAAYSDVMRAHDAHWTAMAGFRVGELYQSLHQEVTAMPRPPGVKGGRQEQAFEGAMRLRYSILLKKGLAMFEQTLHMAERTGEQSRWVSRTRASKAQIERALRDEEELLDRLPFSRDELRRVLAEIQERQDQQVTGDSR